MPPDLRKSASLPGVVIAQNQNGEVLRSVKQVKPGDPIDIHVSDGRISAKVMNKEESE